MDFTISFLVLEGNTKDFLLLSENFQLTYLSSNVMNPILILMERTSFITHLPW